MSALWNKKKLNDMVKQYGNHISDYDTAVCIAEDLLRTKPGLEDWIRNDLNQPEPLYWLASCFC